jgi:hypothetical protein
VDGWAGGALAVIVGGSHAGGEAVWVEREGQRLSLSDLDVYAVVPDRARQRAARSRAQDAGAAHEALRAECGLAAPIEAAFLTPEDLERLPARPGTIELRRHGQVLKGDAAWRERIPDWSAADIGREEVLLLLENRAFELLLAWHGLGSASELERLQARHETLKCALDLATVESLERGQYPESAKSRVALASASGADPALRTLWHRALEWRAGHVEALEAAQGRAEWRHVVEGWVAAWRRVTSTQTRVVDPVERALASAARGRLRRRAKQALGFRARSGEGPSLWSRVRHARRGTPQHRLNATAVVLLLAAARTGTAAPSSGAGDAHPGGPTLGPAELAALRALGVLPAGALHHWPTAGRAAARIWDHWILEGRRTVEPR